MDRRRKFVVYGLGATVKSDRAFISSVLARAHRNNDGHGRNSPDFRQNQP